MYENVLLQPKKPGRGSQSVEGVARTHWIPQLLQVQQQHQSRPVHPYHHGAEGQDDPRQDARDDKKFDVNDDSGGVNWATQLFQSVFYILR